MKDEIFTKTRNDGIWEKNATLGFALYMFIGIGIYFGVQFLFIDFPVIITFIMFLIALVIVSLKANQRYNISKSTAFIKRNEKYYVVQLLYTKRQLGSETSNNMIYAPSGSILQVATLKNNIDVAKNIYLHEQEVRKRREKEENFSIALNDILEYLEKKPSKYHVIPDKKRGKLEKFFINNLENYVLAGIETKNAQYNFLILNNPKILSNNNKNFTISFENENNEQCILKFSNCYGNIIEEINSIKK